MRRFALSCLVLSLLSMSAAHAAEDWQVLFNGKDLDNWEKHGGKAEYKIEDDAIVGNSVPNTRNTFLCTKETYRDFELEFEVMVDDELNSGVQLRSNIKDDDVVYGPQVEIEASPGEAGYIYGESTGRGWLSQPKEHKAFKNGEWNKYRVVFRGSNVKTWINDQPIEDLTDEEMSKEGFIGLQVHGVGDRKDPLYVKWRNIRIRKLDQ